jgi:hypothetical protein
MRNLMKIVIAFIQFLFPKKEDRNPTDNEIADVIDWRLGPDNGRDNGRIIRITRGGYHYYITRSPIRGRGSP